MARYALEQGIPLLQPRKLRAEAFRAQVEEAEAAIGVVVAYGRIIPPAIFSLFPFRTINLHFSMLPEYRGAAPVQRALMDGATRTGMTIFELEEGLDTGPIWAVRERAIEPGDTTPVLWERLGHEAGAFLVDTICGILDGSLKSTPQDHDRATLAPPLTREEGRVDWSLPAPVLVNRFRGMQPWPGLFFPMPQGPFQLTSVRALENRHAGLQAGSRLACGPEGLDVACGAGTVLRIQTMKVPCRSAMAPQCFLLGNTLPDPLP